LTLTLFEYHELKTPVCALRVPAAVSTARFLEFAEAVIEAHVLATALNRDADALLLYGPAYTEGPATWPMRVDWYPTLTSVYPASDTDRRRCYYRIVRGCPASEVSQVVIVQVDFREADGQITTTDIVLPKDAASYAELERRLGREGPLRACSPPYSLTLAPTHLITNGARVIVEVVPEDQRVLADGERLLPVTLAEFSSGQYLQPRGAPAFLKVARGQALGEIAPAVFAALGVTEDGAKKARFFSGATWAHFSAAGALKPETDVSALPYSHALFVLADLKRHARARPREEAIHIYN
jgi:hypothetical protein